MDSYKYMVFYKYMDKFIFIFWTWFCTTIITSETFYIIQYKVMFTKLNRIRKKHPYISIGLLILVIIAVANVIFIGIIWALPAVVGIIVGVIYIVIKMRKKLKESKLFAKLFTSKDEKEVPKDEKIALKNIKKYPQEIINDLKRSGLTNKEIHAYKDSIMRTHREIPNFGKNRWDLSGISKKVMTKLSNYPDKLSNLIDKLK